MWRVLFSLTLVAIGGTGVAMGADAYIRPPALAPSCSTPTDDDYDPATNDCGAGTDAYFSTFVAADGALGAGNTLHCRGTTANPWFHEAASLTFSQNTVTIQEDDGYKCIITGLPEAIAIGSISKTAGQTNTYEFAYDEVANFTISSMVQTNPDVYEEISETDASNDSVVTLIRAVHYLEQGSVALVDATIGTFYHDTTANIAYFHTWDSGDPTAEDYEIRVGPAGAGNINIEGDPVVWTGIDLYWSDIGGNWGMQLNGATAFVMSDVYFWNNAFSSQSSSTATLTNITIEGVIRRGPGFLWTDDGTGQAMSLISTSGAVVGTNILMKNNQNGMSDQNGGNTFTGLYLFGHPNHSSGFDGTGTTVEKCIFLNSQDSVYSDSSTDNTFNHCLFAEAVWHQNGSTGTKITNSVYISRTAFADSTEDDGWLGDYNAHFRVDPVNSAWAIAGHGSSPWATMAEVCTDLSYECNSIDNSGALGDIGVELPSYTRFTSPENLNLFQPVFGSLLCTSGENGGYMGPVNCRGGGFRFRR